MAAHDETLLDVLNRQRVGRGLPPMAPSPATVELAWISSGRLFRLVARESCAEADFMSYEESGRPLPSTSDDRLRLSWAGVSTFLTLEAATARSGALRKEWFAVLEIAADRPVLVVRGRREHVDVYAGPDVLLSFVVEVLRCR